MSNTEQKRLPGQKGEQNNMWKGGRSIASNGYVLIRVDKSHLLSDSRGYAYEHRLVAFEKIGRLFTSLEHVHHINGDKTDNRPENLEVLTIAEHRLEHRGKNSNRKLPDQENELIECACGCGEAFPKFDTFGRPRVYISGHNTPRTNFEPILDFIGDRLVTTKEISSALGYPLFNVQQTMLSLQHQQKITKIKGAKYCQTQYADLYSVNPLIDCACGCSEKFNKFDDSGRTRKYKPGHQFKKQTR